MLAPGAGGLHIIGGNAAVIEALANKIENKTGVVVVQVAVGILETTRDVMTGVDDRLRRSSMAPACDEAWRPRRKAAHDPVQQATQVNKERRETKAALDGREEADLFHRRRDRLASAGCGDRHNLLTSKELQGLSRYLIPPQARLEELELTPLAKSSLIDQRHAHTATCQ